MITQTRSEDEYTVLSKCGFADVWYNKVTNHHSLHSNQGFQANDVITRFCSASTQNFPTYLTVQTGDDTHITLEPQFLQYINHSCDPNVFFDTDSMELVCLRPILPGDELGFFYPSTEWDMAQQFVCICGSNNCLRLIQGAAHLSEELLGRYRLTGFIRQKIKTK
jgi:hypothetical protein